MPSFSELDTSMYAAPVEAKYQPGGTDYLPSYKDSQAQQYGVSIGADQPLAATNPPAPTDPYNSGMVPPPPPAGELYGGEYSAIGPASEYYGGENSARPDPESPPADQYAYFNANNPNYVQTTYPGTDKPTTTRYIPPAGSTYPSVERDRSLPPRPTTAEMQAEAYPRYYPDIDPYFPGEGGRDGTPPPPGRRQVPVDIHQNLFHMYHAGEGAMGRSDPLSPLNAPVDHARPIQGYRTGPGEPSQYTRFRPGWGGRGYLENIEASGGPPAPPPGYVPEVIRHQGKSIRTIDLERAKPRTLSPTPMPPPPNQPPPPPRGGSAYNDEYSPQTLEEMLYWMELARRRRRPQMRGLFGS